MSTMSNEEYNANVKAVWRVTGILAVVTIVEVVAALIYPETMPRLLLNFFFIVMSVAKAYYIISVFMHLGHERRALQLTVLLPTLFLVWAIIAFLWEGSAWLNLRSIWH
ncbi:MAG: cytochrome C oxidase subunit IV family protein [Chitinophagales bacterium]|nr:cytochrome C oxidase subunit IV family protein [Chitinophagales bacterium]